MDILGECSKVIDGDVDEDILVDEAYIDVLFDDDGVLYVLEVIKIDEAVETTILVVVVSSLRVEDEVGFADEV